MDTQNSIESCLNELKRINEQMTQDNLRMDDALTLYRRGLSLVKQAERILDDYQKDIRQLELETSGD